jgi:hypothetical protein
MLSVDAPFLSWIPDEDVDEAAALNSKTVAAHCIGFTK